MQRTQVYLPKSQLDWLKKKASKNQTTFSELMRQLVREKQTSFRFPQAPAGGGESLYEGARRISKKYTKGPKDLAKNLDGYLYGKDLR